MSLAIAANDEMTGVTTFESEACQQVDILGAHFYKPKIAPSQGDLQNLTDYFSRPRLISSGTIPTGQTPFFLQALTVNTLLGTYFPLGLTRLTGVYGIRFKAVYTVQLATTPYHQGLIAATWQYGPVATVASPLGGLTPRASVIGMQTNIPHVLMDVASTTMSVLKVPYLSTSEFLALNESTKNLGTFSLVPILPVTSGAGTSSPTFSLYFHLEDLELLGAMPADFSIVTLQSGKKLSPVTEEFNRDSHPFSSALNSAGQVLSYIAKGIPSLSSLAGPPAWFLGQAARLARFYGFSKPSIVDPPQRMYIQSHANEFNVDVASLTTTVGPFAGNTLAVTPEFAHNEVDEMSLSYILSQYSQLCLGKLETTDASGTMIYATAVSPSSFWFRSRLTGASPFCNVGAPKSSLVNGSQRGFVPTNVFYVASCFKEWKGSFTFRVTFAKTKFHGGRVLAMYIPFPASQVGALAYPSDTPGDIVNTTPGSFGVQPFGYSKLFDLRDSNVFEFEVPYNTPNPYNSFFASIGSFTIYVQDPLIAPSTVPSSVPFLVEVRANSDFELSMPISPLYPPVTSASGSTSSVRYQSGKVLTMTRAEDSMHCIGERVTSIKQLIAIPKFSYAGTIIANTIDTMTLMPWWYGPMMNFTVPATTSFLRETFGFGFYFSQAFAFVRGGTDYHFYPGNSSMSGTMITVSQASVAPGTPVGVGFPNNAPYSSNARVAQHNSTVGVHVRLPAYQKFARYFSHILGGLTWFPDLTNAASTVTIPFDNENPLTQFVATITNYSTGTTQMRISRNAADDAALGLYMGPPLLGLLAPDNVNGSYDLDSTTFL